MHGSDIWVTLKLRQATLGTVFQKQVGIDIQLSENEGLNSSTEPYLERAC